MVTDQQDFNFKCEISKHNLVQSISCETALPVNAM